MLVLIIESDFGVCVCVCVCVMMTDVNNLVLIDIEWYPGRLWGPLAVEDGDGGKRESRLPPVRRIVCERRNPVAGVLC